MVQWDQTRQLDNNKLAHTDKLTVNLDQIVLCQKMVQTGQTRQLNKNSLTYSHIDSKLRPYSDDCKCGSDGLNNK